MTRINQEPGKLLYTGKYKEEEVIIEVYWYNKSEWTKKRVKDISEIDINIKNCWINIIGIHDIKLLKEIGSKFDVSNYILEDIVRVSRHSKIEESKDNIFSIFKMLYLNDEKIKHEHVSMILKRNVLITFQETKGDIFDSIRMRIEENIGSIRNLKIDYLYYSLIDALIDQYFEIVPYVDEKLEKLEYEVIEENQTELEDIYRLRKELLLIKSSVFPIKNILENFLKNNNIIVTKEVNQSFFDVIDNLDQVTDKISIYRELLSSIHETHMSNLSHKMNRVMTTLAIFSAIFIPLSFLAGFFGMNFRYFPGLTSPYGIYIFILLCFVICAGMIYVFKKKKLL